MNNCSKIKCPLNALTFKDCNLTEKECCYFTKQPTNGDIIKALFPNMCKKGTYCEFFFDNKKAVQTNSYMHVSEHWLNEPYKAESEDNNETSNIN